jgi:Peptidase family M28
MKKIILISFLILQSQSLSAQTIIQKDPEIEDMVKAVNADSLSFYINRLVSFGTRNTLSSISDKNRGIGAARNWVLSEFKSFAASSDGRMKTYIDSIRYPADGRRVDTDIQLANVVAILQGTDPQDHRIFLMSGHLDSRRSDIMDRKGDAPGANDDGSGCAAVLECARILSRRTFPATIIFITVSGEEQELQGAYLMANKARTEHWLIEAVLNNDIMGGNNSNQTGIINNTEVRVFSEGLPYFDLDKKAMQIRESGMENDGRSRQLARYVKEIGERYVDNLKVVLIYRPDRFMRGGDHRAYLENGFVAVRVSEMNENYNHQHQDPRMENGIQFGDLSEFMDFEYLRKNTALNLSNLANLAKAPPMPDSVKIDVRNISNFTHLSWYASGNRKAKGYYVMMRETTSAFWQKKIFTNQEEITLPYSKDNYFFAVQSVSETGNESLPVVPQPDNGRK